MKKNSQLIEKWHRFSLGVCEKSHPPGTDRVKGIAVYDIFQWHPWFFWHSINSYYYFYDVLHLKTFYFSIIIEDFTTHSKSNWSTQVKCRQDGLANSSLFMSSTLRFHRLESSLSKQSYKMHIAMDLTHLTLIVPLECIWG